MKNWLQKAKYLTVILSLCFFGIQQSLFAQHFIFEYTGPDTLFVDGDCVAELNWGNTTPTVEPTNPGGGQMITFFDLDNISGGYDQGDLVPAGIQVAVTYLAEDNSGNDSLFTFNIEIVDTIPPMISGIAADITVDCAAVPNPDNVMATDNCDANPSLSFSEIIIPGACEYAYIIAWTWTSSDLYGNSSVESRTVTVVDNMEPTFVLPSDITIDCENAGDLTLTGSPGSVADNCDPNPLIYYSDIFTSGNCPHAYTISRTWSVEDVCGNMAEAVQTITVQDTTKPEFLVEPVDGTHSCDNEANAESAFAAWLSNFGGSVAADNCTNSAALRWFAAVPGSYDLNDTLSFPGIFPSSLNPANCPSPTMGIFRSTEVDFVVYDLCGNAAVLQANFNVIDNTAPIFVSCPEDVSLSNDPGLCEAAYELSVPIITDECENNFATEIFNTSSPIVSNNPGDENTAVNPVVLNFTGIPFAPNSASGPVTMDIELINTDAEGAEEYFTVLGEDGSPLGQTNNTSSQCNNSTTTIMISASSFNNWTIDGVLTITLSPNIPGGQQEQAINDICGGSSVNASITYESKSPEYLLFQYSINGSTPVTVDPIDAIPVLLPVGLNSISYFATDCSGNTGGCDFTITVEDIDMPTIICPADTMAIIGPGDDCNIGKSLTLPLPVSVEDNCSFQTNTSIQPIGQSEALLTFSYDPNYLNYIADDKVIDFTGMFPNTVGTEAILKVTIIGDADEIEEYFTIFSEENDNLGTTEVGQSNVTVLNDTCPNLAVTTTTISIPVSQFNDWASDGVISFNAISNINFANPAPGGPSDGINPSCTTFPMGTLDGSNDGESSMVMELIFETGSISYFSEGATSLLPTEFMAPNIPPIENFNVGMTTFYYVAEDLAGNADTCSFEISVEDTIPPMAQCQPITIFVNPSGVDDYLLDPSEIDAGSMDNCSIVDMVVTPSIFTCDQQGTVVDVTLTVTDVFGNTSDCATIVNVETAQPQPTYTIGICGNDTLSLFANPPLISGGAAFSFLWNGPNGFMSIEENPQIPNADDSYSGSYSVTITGVTGCTAFSTLEVSINAAPDVPIIVVNDNNLCSSDDLILTTQTYSGNSVTYHWYEGTPPTGVLILSTLNPMLTLSSPLTAGPSNYYVIVEVDACFSQPSNFEMITVTQAPIAMVNDPVIDVCEGENFILGTAVTGPNYTYQWLGPNGFNSNLQNPPAVMATLADDGTYTLIISDNNCPSQPVSSEVNVSASPSKPVLNADDIVCEGGELTLSTNILGGDFYTWTAPDFSAQLTTTNTLIISGVSIDQAGDWSVVVTMDGCDSEASDPFEVIVEPALAIFPANDGPVCSLDEVQLSVNSIPGAIYSWSGPNGFNSILQNPIAPANAGNYTVTVTSVSGCTSAATTNVEVNSAPNITAISNDGVPCVSGTQDIHLIATIFPADDGNYLYDWDGSNGFISSDSVPTIPNATSADNGSYTLVVTDGNGCSSLPETTVVDVSDIPNMPSLLAPAELCETENLVLTTQAYNGTSVMYTWTTPTGIFETTIPTLSIISVSVLNSGVYQVEVNVDGCESNPSGEIFITINPVPSTPVLSSNAPVCEGATIELNTAFIPGATYFWTGPNNFSAPLHNPIITDASIDDEGAYSVQVILEGCNSDFSAPVNVTISPAPDPPAISNNGPVCIDSPGASFTLSVSPVDAIPGASYTWFNAQSGAQVAGPTIALNSTIIDFANYGEGVQEFYVIAELNGCPAVSSIPTIVTMNEIPSDQAFAGDDAQLCNETDFEMSATSPSIGSGLWSQTSGSMASILNPNLATTNVSNLIAGNVYTFQWTLSNGACVDYDSDEVTITVDDDLEEAEAGFNFEVCNDTITQLNADPSAFGAAGNWTQTPAQSAMGVVIIDPSDPNSLVTGLEFGNQYVFSWILSNAGCGEFSTDDVMVNVVENYETAFAGDDFANCGDGGTPLNAETSLTGIGTWTSDEPEIVFVDPNDPQTIAQGLQTGFYTFTWTLDNGACGVTSDEVEVEYELAPEAIDDEYSVNYSSSANFNVLGNDLFEGPVTVSILVEPLNGNVENLGNGVLEYTANSSFTGTDEFTYQICSQICEDVCSAALVSLRIGDDVECVAPTIFTPNNDGINDAFIVPCLSTGNYPQNSVSIYNQWGDEVFHASPYQNDWQGTYDGQDLPAGTYYFVVKYNTDQPPASGFLVLER